MASLFQTYFSLGFDHILDPRAFDHIVFLIALCAVYTWAEWKQLAILVTAFTIGHSLTLAMAVLDVIQFSSTLVETLIPITIMITALLNVVLSTNHFQKQKRWHYVLALVFGFIHGMGFSGLLKQMQLLGEDTLLMQLFAFNIGIEVGQLLIVTFIMGIVYLILNVLNIRQLSWKIFISGATFGIGIILLLQLFYK